MDRGQAQIPEKFYFRFIKCKFLSRVYIYIICIYIHKYFETFLKEEYIPRRQQEKLERDRHGISPGGWAVSQGTCFRTATVSGSQGPRVTLKMVFVLFRAVSYWVENGTLLSNCCPHPFSLNLCLNHRWLGHYHFIAEVGQ